jgi:hypothetical protein
MQIYQKEHQICFFLIFFFQSKVIISHLGLATILEHQLKEKKENIFLFLNRLKNAKTIGQKRKCTRWRHLGLAAILKR